MGNRLSIVIPALNAATRLPACLAATREAGLLVADRVVVDGGSTDATAVAAREGGARVVIAPRGRGGQLAAGAAAATGEWLLFLHADTVLSPGWARAAAGFMRDTGKQDRAASFRFALDERSPGARRLEALVAWRCSVLGLPYGDQGLLIGRALYEAIGGFRPMPLYEDVDIVRRIGRARIAILPVAAVTAADRYRSAGYVLRPMRNLFCLGLYFAGVPPRILARLYG